MGLPACVFRNGPIVTMEPGAASAECVVTEGDRIAFVGPLDAGRALIAERGLVAMDYDLDGAALLPGFIDAHLHPLPMIFFAMSANLDALSSLEEVRAALTRQAERIDAGEWVIGVQLEENKLQGGDALSRRELDAWLGDVPALVYSRDGHAVFVNSAVLEKAGLGADTAIPDGGEAGRFMDGELNGVFREKAVGLPLAHMPPPSIPRMIEASKACFDALARSGITSIGAMLQSDEEGPGGEAAQLEAIAMQAIREHVPQSIYAIVIGKTLDGVKAMADSPMNDPQNATRTRAFKIFADGTFGSCTACMSEPYADKTCSHGFMTLPEDDIYARMEAAHLAGFQVCIHAIGDEGIAKCVDLFERLLAAHPREDHRHRIEHASFAPPELVARIAGLGLQICTQPLFIRSEMAWLPRRLGPSRTPMAYPFRSFFDAGIALAGSSDAPIEATDTIAAIDFAVNRGGFHPEQGVSVEEALAMFTRNAAFVQFEETEKGTLQAGKRADLVILDRNPLTVPPDQLGRIAVQRTMIGGIFTPN